MHRHCGEGSRIAVAFLVWFHLFLSVPYLCRWMLHLGVDLATVVEWSNAAALMSDSNRSGVAFSSRVLSQSNQAIPFCFFFFSFPAYSLPGSQFCVFCYINRNPHYFVRFILKHITHGYSISNIQTLFGRFLLGSGSSSSSGVLPNILYKKSFSGEKQKDKYMKDINRAVSLSTPSLDFKLSYFCKIFESCGTFPS